MYLSCQISLILLFKKLIIHFKMSVCLFVGKQERDCGKKKSRISYLSCNHGNKKQTVVTIATSVVTTATMVTTNRHWYP